jgi:hypothetical protein
LRHLCIAWVWARRGIHHQYDEIGIGYSHARLILYLNVNHVTQRRLHPSRVNKPEAKTVPVGDCDQSITRRPCAILNDRAALANETVEERTLPNVWTTDQRDKWESLLCDLFRHCPSTL